MKKQLLSLSVLVLTASAALAQTTETVSVGANYINQKWYSLETGTQPGTDKDNWDIGFEITGYTSAIIANGQKPNFVLYQAPYKIADYATIDTAGMANTWKKLYNSDTTWTVGAFNKGANLSNPSDLGWGVYDMNTHIVSGDSCYVVKISATSFKKLKIVNLNGGVYNFEYSDLNGANSQTASITKTNYTGKNFAYYNLATNAAVDNEPVSANWDLVFGRYMAYIPTPYAVMGVMQNKGVTVAQADDVANPATYVNWQATSMKTNITTIGHDWKTFALSTNQWGISGDTVYFVKDKPGNIWKLRFLSFGGATNGNVVFTKEKLVATGLADVKGNVISQVSVYPNPSNGNTALMFANDGAISNVSVSIMDLNGKVLSSEIMNVEAGINQYPLNTTSLTTGVYFVRLNAGSYTATQKLIIQ